MLVLFFLLHLRGVVRAVTCSSEEELLFLKCSQEISRSTGGMFLIKGNKGVVNIILYIKKVKM